MSKLYLRPRPLPELFDQSTVPTSVGPSCQPSRHATAVGKSNRPRLILIIAMIAVACNQMIATNAFSFVDLGNGLTNRQSLQHALKWSAAPMPSSASMPLAASQTKTDMESENKEAARPPPLPTRNWRICTKSIVEDISGSSSSSRPAVSPFDQSAGIGRESDDESHGVHVSSDGWSADAYESALNLYNRLIEYCDAHENDDTNTAEDGNLPHLIMSALDILHQAYRLYGPESVIGSYNGGKDACVVLHLMRATYANYIRESPNLSHSDGAACQPKTIYFENKDEFPEVIDLLHETVVEYDLNMVAFDQSIKFADGLSSVVSTNYIGQTADSSRPFPMAFVLGTRRGDPNAGNQGAFAPSSSYMPAFMRVNPILTPEWTYADVWAFLRKFDLKYCQLYDKGYTSLGTVKDTKPCPALKKDALDLSWEEDTGNVLNECNGEYWPAYMLKDFDQERAGRIKKNNK